MSRWIQLSISLLLHVDLLFFILDWVYSTVATLKPSLLRSALMTPLKLLMPFAMLRKPLMFLELAKKFWENTQRTHFCPTASMMFAIKLTQGWLFVRRLKTTLSFVFIPTGTKHLSGGMLLVVVRFRS